MIPLHGWFFSIQFEILLFILLCYNWSLFLIIYIIDLFEVYRDMPDHAIPLTPKGEDMAREAGKALKRAMEKVPPTPDSSTCHFTQTQP